MTATSPGRLSSRTRSTIVAATRVDRSGTNDTPERPVVAAHWRGTPLDSIPPAKTQHVPVSTGVQRCRAGCLVTITAGADSAQPGRGERGEHVVEASWAEVEHVVVRQGARVRTGDGQAADVVRAHPIMHGPPGRELSVRRDAGLQIDQPDSRGELLHDRQGVAPGPGEADRTRNRPVQVLCQCHVRQSVIDRPLPKRGIGRVWEDLIDPPACHDVSAEQQCQRIHGIILDRPDAA
jgi:hypothetical protein